MSAPRASRFEAGVRTADAREDTSEEAQSQVDRDRPAMQRAAAEVRDGGVGGDCRGRSVAFQQRPQLTEGLKVRPPAVSSICNGFRPKSAAGGRGCSPAP